MTAPVHGGGIAAAERRWGRPAAPWLDLSTGINPWPYPVPALEPAVWQRLPDDDAMHMLAEAARRYYGTPPACPIAAASGSQAIIGLLPQLFSERRVLTIGWTYAEHAYRWRIAGHDVVELSELPETDALRDAIIILANPNNPDGRVIEPERLMALAERLARSGGLLIVDEAFADVVPAVSLSAMAGQNGLLILRSFGKFFGLAGLRLGLALGEAGLIQRLEAALGPWAVSGPALAIGARAMADTAWVSDMRQRLTAAGSAFDQTLRRLTLEPVGGTPLFRLVRRPQAVRLADALAQSGILVRSFAERPDWLRIGLPPDESATARLTGTLSRLLGVPA
jgi:cobalamin biosynthetic protein CobC